MAGGQERILRRRIKSVQSTRKITKAMELIAASQISRSPGAHHREPSVPRRDATHHRRSGQGRSGRRGEAPRDARARRDGDRAGADRRPRPLRRLQLLGDARRRTTGAQARRRGHGRRNSSASARRPAPSSVSAASTWPSGFVGMSDRPTFDDARRIAADGRRAVRQRRGPTGPPGLDAIPLGRHPERRSANNSCRCRCRRCPKTTAPKVLKGYTEFEPEVAQLLIRRSRPRPSRARSSPRSWKARRRSTSASSAPWPPPPTTPMNSARTSVAS